MTRHVVHLAMGLAASASPAFADMALDTGASLKLRYEHADVEGFDDESDALTLRASGFFSLEPTSWLTLLTEIEAVAPIAGNFDDGEGAPEPRPIIADPGTFQINRAFAEIRPSDAISLKVGRQSISLGEERFVGTVAFRQNHQSFDAVRANISLPFGVLVDVSQLAAVQRPFGLRGLDRRVTGDASLLKVTVPTPLGQLAGFRYDLDLGQESDGTAFPGSQSVTLGASIDGRYGNERGALSWAAAYAQQEDDQTGTTAPYLKAQLGLELAPWSLRARHERLGGGDQPFQTALGTNHKFQGLADLFLVTPAGGLEDNSIRSTWTLGQVGALKKIAFTGTYHQFDAANDDRDLGDEIDLTAGASFAGVRWTVERAQYRAEDFGVDTVRWYLTAQRKF